MLRRVTLFSTCIIFCFVASCMLHFCLVRKGDTAHMTLLLKEEKKPSQEKSKLAHQKRQGIVKEIWLTSEKGDRLHDVIKSDHSILTLIPKKNKVDIVEYLGKTHLWMQDKLYYGEMQMPMQQMRLFSADQGCYRFQNHTFDANHATLSFFRINGHTLQEDLEEEEAYLKGNAKDLTFTLDGKHMRFKADTFRARLKHE